MAMATDIKAMSDEELMEAWTADGQAASDLKERLKEYSTEYQERCLLKQTVDLIGVEGVAAIQGMSPVGVESSQAVGNPGDQEEVSLDG